MSKQKAAPKKTEAPKAPGTRTETPPRMLTLYRNTIASQLTKEFDYDNPMEVPRIAKVVVNIGIGEAKDNDKALDAAVGDVVTITGQKPALIKARKSVAAFKLRAGQIVGIKTTLRGRRMWLDRLRQDRQAPRAGSVDRDHSPHRRRGAESFDTPRHAIQEEVRIGEEITTRALEEGPCPPEVQGPVP